MTKQEAIAAAESGYLAYYSRTLGYSVRIVHEDTEEHDDAYVFFYESDVRDALNGDRPKFSGCLVAFPDTGEITPCGINEVNLILALHGSSGPNSHPS